MDSLSFLSGIALRFVPRCRWQLRHARSEKSFLARACRAKKRFEIISRLRDFAFAEHFSRDLRLYGYPKETRGELI